MNGNISNIACRVFTDEALAINSLKDLLTIDFENAVQAILDCKGKVIVTGLGKSGLIGRKIAATLTSTGTLSTFMHPAEAFHGDLGMIAALDIILAITNSGETDEVVKLIPFFKNNLNKIIALTGEPESTVGKHSDFILNIHVDKEVCPLNLAPTTSAATMLAMGDALAITLMELRNFKNEDYAKFHPGGSLGKRLLTKAKDVMRTSNLPIVSSNMILGEVIIEISKARLGMAVVIDNEIIKGVVTDGDIRRRMEIQKSNFFDIQAKEIMNVTPKSIEPDKSIMEVENLMRSHQIHSLLVCNETKKLMGIIEHYDIYLK